MSSKTHLPSVLLGALIAYFFLNQPTKLVQEKIVYMRHCSDFKHNVFSCPSSTRVSEQKFMIFLERQIVTAVGIRAYKYEDCAVFDADNWTCDLGNRAYVGVSKGGFFESNNGSLDKQGEKSPIPLGQEIYAFEYHIQSVRDFFRIYF